MKNLFAIKCDKVYSVNLEKLLHYLVSDTQMYFQKEDRKMGHSEFCGL